MAKKVKKTAYQVAAEELNDVMGLKPAIDATLEDEKLKPYLMKAIDNIEDDDEFTDETQEVIDALLKEKKAAKKAGKGKEAEAPAKGKGKKQAEPDPEDEEEDDDDDDDDDSDEEEEEQPKKVAKPAKAPEKGKGKKQPEPDEDEDEDEDEEQPEPAKPAKGKKDSSEKKSDSGESKKRGNFVAAEYTRIDAVCEALKAKPKTVAAWSEKADALLEKHGGKANDKENKAQIKKIQAMAKHFDFGVTVPKA